MPSAVKTPNIGLNQWAGNEYVKRQDFVDDNLLIDTEIGKRLINTNYIRQPGYAVATGSANTYAVTLSPAPTAYVDGLAVCVKINVASTGASTLNVNSLGAIAIKDSLGNAITAGGLKANTPYTLRYESSSNSFIVQGKGGGGNATAADLLSGKTATVDTGQITGTLTFTGTAATADVLSGKTFYNTDPTTPITGTMANNGAGGTVTPTTSDQTKAAGYYTSIITIKGDVNLVTGNIRAGVSIFGVSGKASVVDTADATAIAGQILAAQTGYVNGSKITGTMPNKTGAAVTITPGTADQAIPQGYYPGGTADGKVKGDANLLPTNIASGVTIFGVSGSASNIKSIQRGTFTMASGTGVQYVTIAAVDLTKSIVRMSEKAAPSPVYTNNIFCEIEFTSSTQLLIQRNGSGGTVDVAWEVVEFNNVKSRQKGSLNLSSQTNVTVTSINPNKSMLFGTFITAETGPGQLPYMLPEYWITDATTITIATLGTSILFVWFLIEFS